MKSMRRELLDQMRYAPYRPITPLPNDVLPNTDPEDPDFTVEHDFRCDYCLKEWCGTIAENVGKPCPYCNRKAAGDVSERIQ
jgi:hypothetical protein